MKNDLTEDQITPVLRQLLPALLEVLGQPQVRDAVESDPTFTDEASGSLFRHTRTYHRRLQAMCRRTRHVESAVS